MFRRDLTQRLFEAKISAPRPRPGAVSRANLVRTVRSSARRFVSVTAPAGYGKTTFLAQWAEAEDRPVAWVSLDRFDDDPAVLLISLLSAYRHAGLGSADLIADMGGNGAPVLARAAPRLISEFSACPVPFVLLLDDVHELMSRAAHDVLALVISGMPRGSQLAVAGRAEEHYLPRLRASGDALELRAADLVVDAAGTRQIFANAQVSLTTESAATVTERAEGWPAGIYLAALAARDNQCQARAVTGEDRYVADYLYREVLLQQPQVVQRFLRRTAVLERLCGPLCDAVLGSATAGETLRGLEDRSLFLLPLDRHRDWYRYHALFREFLLAELSRTEPGIIVSLHRRAANWYESHGSPALALEHLLHTSDWDRSMRLAAAQAVPMYNSGQMATSQRWYRIIGDENIARYPPLAVLRCYEAARTGDAAGALRWAAIVDAAAFDDVPPDGSASFESARAMLRAVMCAAGPEVMMADAVFAVAAEPAWSQWHTEAMWSLGEANLLAGERDKAHDILAKASAAAVAGNPHTVIMCESELALLAMDRGDWHEAAERLDRAFATIEEMRLHNCVTSLLASAGAARLSVHRGDLEEARGRLAGAMRARQSATAALPIVAVRLRLQLAKVYLSMSEHAAARQLLSEIDDILILRPELGTLAEEVEDFRSSLASTIAPATTGRPPLTPAELRLLPYLQTHLTADRIAERLFLSSHTVKTQVKSIYRKLDVSSRNDAVQRATTIGLLG